MQVTCARGHDQEISDPSDEGWEYSYKETFEPVTVTLPNGEETQIQHRVGVPVSRRLVWKCAASDPTDEHPLALCGQVEVLEEDIAPSAEADEGGDQ